MLAAATMLAPALAAFFRYKVVHTIFVLACWSPFEQVQLMREMSKLGYSATFVCGSPASATATAMDRIPRHGLQGVLYFQQPDDDLLLKLGHRHFCGRYVWAVIADEIPAVLNQVRYDAELVLLRAHAARTGNTGISSEVLSSKEVIHLEDIYIHPREGASVSPWAVWSAENGLYVRAELERARILRRLDLKGYPLRIAAPVGYYSEEWYNGTYAEYVADETLIELDSSIKCSYSGARLILDALNATEVLITTELWSATIHNNSMLLMLHYGEAELSGGMLRILPHRIELLDYVVPIWPYRLGFVYLAERGSSTNMFLSPFSARVWYACAAVGLVLCAALRITARSQEEKDQACYSVLATWLQQDASGVPRGLSGRWTFVVVSASAMLVHAYYTSAIVSALMNVGYRELDSLRALADSQYSIVSEDVAYMRYQFFDVETNWDDLEYLKRKKKTANFYQEMERGVQLMRQGRTAFHSEFNLIYPHLKTFRDDESCKLQHVDTVPQVMTWLTSTRHGQYSSALRAGGARLLEAGLGARLVARYRARPPPCRAHLLAERVRLADVAPLLALAACGAALAVLLLALEILVARNHVGRETNRMPSISTAGRTDTSQEDFMIING